MPKKLAILLLGIHLMGNTELGQLFKFPQLVHHFFQHKRLQPELGFFEFIAMHYAGDDGTTADDDWDKQLPYHNTDKSTITIVYSPMVKEVPVSNYSLFTSGKYNDPLEEGISSKHVLLILQPPRQA